MTNYFYDSNFKHEPACRQAGFTNKIQFIIIIRLSLRRRPVLTNGEKSTAPLKL